VPIEVADAANAPVTAIEFIETFVSTDPRGEIPMPLKVNIVAAAVLLGAFATPVGVFAQNYGGTSSMLGHQFHAQSKHLKTRLPSDARGSAVDSDVFPVPAVRSGGHWFETDPDPRIRFEMNRDDRDRRSGG